MPNTSSNIILYSTLVQQPPVPIDIPAGTTSNTITQIVTAASTNTLVHDILFRVASSISYDIIICPIGSQATVKPIVQITIPTN